MARIYKQKVTRPLPRGAVVSTNRHGELVARWINRAGEKCSAPIRIGRDGTHKIVTEAPCYYMEYHDQHGRLVREPTGCTMHETAWGVLQEKLRQIERIRAGIVSEAELAEAKQKAAPLADLIDRYVRHLEASDYTANHVQAVRTYLAELSEACNWRTLADVTRASLKKWMEDRKSDGMGARARNVRRAAAVAFANWLCREDVLEHNPLSAVPKANEKLDQRHPRRAMTAEELEKLLKVARDRPLEDAYTIWRNKRGGRLPGHLGIGRKRKNQADLRPETVERLQALGLERALIYKTLILTGLRKSELARLRIADLRLEDNPPHLRLQAGSEKSRQGNALLLRADLADDLRHWLTVKLQMVQADAQKRRHKVPETLASTATVFTVPGCLIRILDRDLKRAGIAKVNARGERLDIHALRKTHATLLLASGVSPAVVKTSMRHSTIELTTGTYLDQTVIDTALALDKLPELPIRRDDGESNSG
jgi:integrase